MMKNIFVFDYFRNYDFSHFQVEYIYGISVLENFLYLSDRHENTVVKMHRYNYSVEPQILIGNLSLPGQVHVYHRARQPMGKSGISFRKSYVILPLN